jgi:hypothetical protein
MKKGRLDNFLKKNTAGRRTSPAIDRVITQLDTFYPIRDAGKPVRFIYFILPAENVPDSFKGVSQK